MVESPRGLRPCWKCSAPWPCSPQLDPHALLHGWLRTSIVACARDAEDELLLVQAGAAAEQAFYHRGAGCKGVWVH